MIIKILFWILVAIGVFWHLYPVVEDIMWCQLMYKLIVSSPITTPIARLVEWAHFSPEKVKGKMPTLKDSADEPHDLYLYFSYETMAVYSKLWSRNTNNVLWLGAKIPMSLRVVWSLGSLLGYQARFPI